MEDDQSLVMEDITARLLACSIATLAIDLARQAGEEATRPLSRDQLSRVFQVNSQELYVLMQLMEARWARSRIQPR